MSKKRIALLVGLAIILTPIIINNMATWSIFADASGEFSSWLSFWGSYAGGIISGSLTLIGVILTINSSFKQIKLSQEQQGKEKFKENLGEKLSKLYELKGIIDKTDRMFSERTRVRNSDDIDKAIDGEIKEYLFLKFNYLMQLAAAVDYELFEDISGFVKDAQTNLISFNDEKYDSFAFIVKQLTADIESKHEKRLYERFKEVSKNN